MVGIVKIAAVSAVLAAAVVTIGEARHATEPARFLAERYAAEPVAPAAPQAERCSGAAWPYVDEACLAANGGRTIRRIDLDRVQAPSAAALVRTAGIVRTIR